MMVASSNGIIGRNVWCELYKSMIRLAEIEKIRLAEIEKLHLFSCCVVEHFVQRPILSFVGSTFPYLIEAGLDCL